LIFSVLLIFYHFLNTLIRPSQIKYVTAKQPVLGIGGSFIGKARIGVGEKIGRSSSFCIVEKRE
jgi:hypothetical protein